jgi:malonyl-CoA O-methyltransferase
MLNKRRIREDFSKAANSYDAAAIVQHEICARALERLQMLKLNPEVILDIGSGTGKSVRGLQATYPDSRVIASDVALQMLKQGHQRHTASSVCCDAEYLPFKDESVDLIFSTSTIQWCEDIDQVFKDCLRILHKDGVLVFSTFGPDTLLELRQSWAKVDGFSHVHGFIDMHHIGDLLLTNHYADPVVDMEMITIEYRQIHHLLRDLKATGSRGKFSASDRSSDGSSFAGLMGKNRFQQFEQAYESYRQNNGLLPASYEVIYGYARKLSINKGASISASGEVKIPVDQIK